MLIGRVEAYGKKWHTWYQKTKHTSRHKEIAERYRRYKLIEVQPDAEYEVAEKLTQAFEDA